MLVFNFICSNMIIASNYRMYFHAAGWTQDIALDKDELERETTRAKQRYLEQRLKAPTVDIAIDVLTNNDKKELNNDEISLLPLKHRSAFRRHRRNRHKNHQRRRRQRRGKKLRR